MPNFILSDLHIDPAIPTYIESGATPIAGIDTNFDGGSRNVSTPDIGADEFDGTIVSVEAEVNGPLSFELEQNYPNPFNPSTKINFRITKRSNVSLKVFNLLGSEIAKLVKGEIEAGEYEISFDASVLPSGVYFYKLQTGDFVETKKMMLLK